MIPNLIKITIEVEGITTDVTNDIVQEDSLEILQERDDVSGVITFVSFPVKLRGKGRELLKTAFDANGLYTQGKINIYKRGDYDNDYTLLKSSPIDFSTYKETDSTVSVECAESELMDIINSEGKTKYDIPVAEIKEIKQWDYKRMEMRNIGKYSVPLDTPVETTIDNGLKSLEIKSILIPISLSSISQVRGTTEVDFKDQSFGVDNSSYFIKTDDRNVEFNFNTNISVNVDIELGGQDNETILSKTFSFGIFSKDKNDGKYYQLAAVAMERYAIIIVDDYTRKGRFRVDFAINSKLTIPSYEEVSIGVFFLEDGFWGSCTKAKITVDGTKSDKFEAYYYDSGRENVKIDVISPEKLLNKYLSMMSGDNRFTGTIEWKENEYRTMVVAAESIRGFGVVPGSPAATLHGSPNDFFEWMKVLGYEPVISGDNITFKTRDKVFLSDDVAMELQESDVADLTKQADSTHAYTSVEIGYEKQDYENANGIFEANGTFTYTTGYIAREDNKLSLISPYRVDPMGIEFLCNERSSYTTDNKGDNDIFFVAMTEGETYKEYRGLLTLADGGNISMFNAVFNPYFLVKRNESLIGINSKRLKFKSTDVNRDARIQRYNIYSDIDITQRLFRPMVYNFATGYLDDLPTFNENGVVRFRWDGEVLEGYVKSIRKNYNQESETTWELHVK